MKLFSTDFFIYILFYYMLKSCTKQIQNIYILVFFFLFKILYLKFWINWEICNSNVILYIWLLFLVKFIINIAFAFSFSGKKNLVTNKRRIEGEKKIEENMKEITTDEVILISIMSLCVDYLILITFNFKLKFWLWKYPQ